MNRHGRFCFMTMTPAPFPSIFLAAINHLLAQEPWARGKLSTHAGKIACMDAGLFKIVLKVAPDGMLQTVEAKDAADVTIRVKPSDLPELIRQRDRAFSYVKIEGDADFANTISQLSQSLRWDVEEDLSKWIGDIAAVRTVAGVRHAARTILSMHRSLAENLAEYLLEENPTLVRPAAVSRFAEDVVKLRDDVERMIKRIEKLERRAP